MKVKIKSFNGELPSYLTVGKEYHISGCSDKSKIIYDNDNQRTFICIECCRHLNGGSWEIIE